MRLAAKELASVRTIGSWPTRSSKRIGRYFRASTRYGEPGDAGASATGKSESLNCGLSQRERVDGGAASLDGPPALARTASARLLAGASGRVDKDPPWLVRGASFRT